MPVMSGLQVLLCEPLVVSAASGAKNVHLGARRYINPLKGHKQGEQVKHAENSPGTLWCHACNRMHKCAYTVHQQMSCKCTLSLGCMFALQSMLLIGMHIAVGFTTAGIASGFFPDCHD